MGDTVLDLAAAAPLAFEEIDTWRWDMLSLLEARDDDSSLDAAVEIAMAVTDQLGGGGWGDDEATGGLPTGLTIGGAAMLLPLDAVRLLAPLPRPASMRLFMSSEQHAAAVYRYAGRHTPPQWAEEPRYTMSNHGAIFGPEAGLPAPRTRALDYGLSLACVIGRSGRHIAEEDALEYIGGLLIANDWTARDTEAAELALGIGPGSSKAFGTSLGPWLVTPDELEERLLPDGRYNLTLVARVNGEERSRANTRDSFFTLGQLIAQASRDAPLVPGDVIVAGAADGGSLLEQTGGAGPWLEPGDSVELAISGLGTLANRIVFE
jgi:fumarylacetoacetate (FAA) hydrolase